MENNKYLAFLKIKNLHLRKIIESMKFFLNLKSSQDLMFGYFELRNCHTSKGTT